MGRASHRDLPQPLAHLLFVTCHSETLFADRAALFLTKCFKVFPRCLHPRSRGGKDVLGTGSSAGTDGHVAPKGSRTCRVPEARNSFSNELSCPGARPQASRECPQAPAERFPPRQARGVRSQPLPEGTLWPLGRPFPPALPLGRAAGGGRSGPAGPAAPASPVSAGGRGRGGLRRGARPGRGPPERAAGMRCGKMAAPPPPPPAGAPGAWGGVRRRCQRLLYWVPVLFISSILCWSYYAYVTQLCLRECRRGGRGARRASAGRGREQPGSHRPLLPGRGWRGGGRWRRRVLFISAGAAPGRRARGPGLRHRMRPVTGWTGRAGAWGSEPHPGRPESPWASALPCSSRHLVTRVFHFHARREPIAPSLSVTSVFLRGVWSM